MTASPLDSLSASERSRWWRLRFAAHEWLTRSLVVVPTLYIVAALVLGKGVGADRGGARRAVDSGSRRTPR